MAFCLPVCLSSPCMIFQGQNKTGPGSVCAISFSHTLCVCVSAVPTVFEEVALGKHAPPSLAACLQV